MGGWLFGSAGGWVGLVGVMGWVVGPQDFCVIPWHFENGALIKIDDVLTEDGGLLHVYMAYRILVLAPIPF